MTKPWRPTDRAEYVLSCVLAMGVLLLAVVAASAFVVGYSGQMERAHQTSASATTSGLQPDAGATPTAPTPGESTQGGPAMISGSVSGVSMSGVGVGIWVDERGRPVPPPPGAGRALIRAATDAGTVLIAGGALLAGLWYVARRGITRRNLRRWELEWRRVGPEWSRGAR